MAFLEGESKLACLDLLEPSRGHSGVGWARPLSLKDGRDLWQLLSLTVQTEAQQVFSSLKCIGRPAYARVTSKIRYQVGAGVYAEGHPEQAQGAWDELRRAAISALSGP